MISKQDLTLFDQVAYYHHAKRNFNSHIFTRSIDCGLRLAMFPNRSGFFFTIGIHLVRDNIQVRTVSTSEHLVRRRGWHTVSPLVNGEITTGPMASPLPWNKQSAEMQFYLSHAALEHKVSRGPASTKERFNSYADLYTGV